MRIVVYEDDWVGRFERRRLHRRPQAQNAHCSKRHMSLNLWAEWLLVAEASSAGSAAKQISRRIGFLTAFLAAVYKTSRNSQSIISQSLTRSHIYSVGIFTGRAVSEITAECMHSTGTD